MAQSNEHRSGAYTRKVASGYQGIAYHGDGTCTKTWAVTQGEALRKAENLL